MTWGAEAYLIKSSDLGKLKQKGREVFAGLQKAAKKTCSGNKIEGSLRAVTAGRLMKSFAAH
jgi:hypothetical protein